MGTISIGLLCCAISKHITTDYAPAGGYNESHKSLGLHVERAGPGWKQGVMAMTFKDSFAKRSTLAAGTLTYQWGEGDKLHAALGGGVGYIRTSYYAGLYVAPLAEVGYGRLTLQGSIQAPVSGADAVAAVQAKLRLVTFGGGE